MRRKINRWSLFNVRFNMVGNLWRIKNNVFYYKLQPIYSYVFYVSVNFLSFGYVSLKIKILSRKTFTLAWYKEKCLKGVGT